MILLPDRTRPFGEKIFNTERVVVLRLPEAEPGSEVTSCGTACRRGGGVRRGCRGPPGDEGRRESVRAMRAEDGLLLGVLDDDPTGSQSGARRPGRDRSGRRRPTAAALDAAAAACFVLTNTRSLGEPAAVG